MKMRKLILIASLTILLSACNKTPLNQNKTVDAINNGTVENTGTWDGNSATRTTSANFTGAVYPLNLINGNWNIDRNGWTYVEASQTIGTETKTMKLVKE